MKEIGKMSLIGDKIKSYSEYDPKFLRAGTQELTTNESSKNIKPWFNIYYYVVLII